MSETEKELTDIDSEGADESAVGSDSGDDTSTATEAKRRKQKLQEKLGAETLTKRPQGKVSFRKTNSIAPNATITQNYFADAEALTFVYLESDNILYMQPLPEHDEEAVDEYSIDTTGKSFAISATAILRKIGAYDEDRTERYTAEWDDELQAVAIDLDQEPEVVVSDSTD
jgi:hypothetical protein